MKKSNTILQRLLLLSLTVLAVMVVNLADPKSTLAQFTCNPNLQPNNCGPDYQTPVPGSICPVDYRCTPYPPDIGGGECILCSQQCSLEGQPCQSTSDCCLQFLTCNLTTGLCEVSPSPTCTAYGGLCDPDTGEGDDGPCCADTQCLFSPPPGSGQWRCARPGDACRHIGGDCRDVCMADESPASDGPMDCPAGQSCCVYSSGGECIGTRTEFTGFLRNAYDTLIDYISGNPICPDNTFYDGSNPPDDGYPLLMTCCVTPPEGYDPFLERPGLNPICAVNGEYGIDTAIGCIPVQNTTSFMAFMTRFAISIAGGIGFFLIIVASFQILASGGNADRLKSGKELLIAAVIGIVLAIFSVFVLEFIGVRILYLPGF
jgi:hypothetical protein